MTQGSRKLFAGARLRTLRAEMRLTQREFAQRLEISTSYLNQIENNQRPLSASVMLGLVETFGIDLAEFANSESDKIVVDLREVLVDPVFGDRIPSAQEIKVAASNSPDIAHALVTLHRAYQATQDRLASLDDALRQDEGALLPQPYEEVRDFFHYKDNYVDALDVRAESFAQEVGLPDGEAFKIATDRLYRKHGVRLTGIPEAFRIDGLRIYDPGRRELALNPVLPRPSQTFQLLQQIALLEQQDAIELALDEGNFQSTEARSIAKMGLTNYFAGAAMMPYARFLTSAKDLRHDTELLAEAFQASIEQVSHRLSTLQRPGKKGVPFFFLRVDRAGTITKRHSATRLQFARFGGACPLWNVHQAFERPGQVFRQLAETPDGARYFCLARTITKRQRGFNTPIRRYAIALGCQTSFARELVYADDLDLANDDAYDKIGISCRICERMTCPQRSMPPIGHRIKVDHNTRRVVPFQIED